MAPGVITAVCLWLFCGAVGKSAQFPLYVWLPDAMEGPTPVSALIHAATMVTAGVYMVARSFPLYSLSETAMMVVALTGAFTAIFAASMALVQFDIKRVLAYSTISQLGYMFMALGVGSFTAGIFHLMTHAFFKALLFLCAGSLMHAMHHEIDFRKMGGLKKPLSKTYLRFFVGALAIAGIVPFAGFFSKDAILLGAFTSHHGKALWVIGSITAFMTAYYTFRVVYRTFYGEPRDHHLYEHAHESPSVMIVPLSALAVLSLIGGWVGIPGMDYIGHWLEPVLPQEHHEVTPSLEYGLMGLALAVAVGGILLARYFHKVKPEVADRLAAENSFFSRAHSLLFHKWYVDELYDFLFVRPIVWISEKVLFRIVDVNIIDGIVNDIGALLRGAGGISRRMQTGDARTYAAAILIGALGLILYFVWKVNG
jgi:NADH-quinone oxidoreductase subunit L